MLALGDERLEILRLAREAAKKGYKYDYKKKQYDFNFAKGGEVCRGQGRVRKPRKFRVALRGESWLPQNKKFEQRATAYAQYDLSTRRRWRDH